MVHSVIERTNIIETTCFILLNAMVMPLPIATNNIVYMENTYLELKCGITAISLLNATQHVQRAMVVRVLLQIVLICMSTSNASIVTNASGLPTQDLKITVGVGMIKIRALKNLIVVVEFLHKRT